MHALTLRPAAADDLERVMQLEVAGFAAGQRETRDVYAQRIETFADGSLLAMLGGDVVGCLFCEIWPAGTPCVEHFALGHDIRGRHTPQHGSELYLASMTIDPAYRGHGLGARLLAGGIDYVACRHAQLHSALLLVNAEWRRARRIYVGQGFREIARFAGFFTPTGRPVEDAIVMRRAIRIQACSDGSSPPGVASR